MSKSPDPRAEAIRTGLSDAFGTDLPPLQLTPTGGGCINQAASVHVGGRAVFCKWNRRPLPRQFEAEAAGLRAMGAAGSGLVIPDVYTFGDAGPDRAFLAIEHLPRGDRGPDFDEALGRGLAAMHRATDPRGFGFALDGYCGATPQPNSWTKDWLSFYRDLRLGHQLRLARDHGMRKRDADTIGKLIDKLDGLLTAGDETSSLIHGDLWSGNLLVTAGGRPALIDPAAYFGHREAELGMMALFGGFSPRVFGAYDEAWPLEPGWRDRLELYSLYHVLNHFNLFGGTYGDAAVRIARRYSP